MAGSAKTRRSGGKTQARGKSAAGSGLFTPLRVAWLLLLLLVLAGAAGFLFAQQQGGPRKGVGLTLELPPEVRGDGPAPTVAAAAPPAPEPEAATPEPAATAAPDPDPAVEESTAEAPPAAPAVLAGSMPRIAVVITGLGMARDVTEQALRQLPTTVALSFSPYAPQVGEWIALARTKGHEVLLDLPMEPVTFPNDNPGSLALMTHLEPAENQERLTTILGLGQGYVGLVAVMGSRFLGAERQLEPVLRELARRGLLFLDNRSSDDSRVVGLATKLGLAHAVSDRALDDALPSRELIESRLLQVERLAFSQGASIAHGRSYPATLELVARWAKELEGRGLALAPLTQVVGLSRDR